MTVAELALLITTLSGAIAALMGVRINAIKLSDVQKQLDESKTQHAKDRADIERNRTDLISIGEALAETREDLTIVTDAFNRVYREYNEQTGHKPTTDLVMLRNLHRIKYNTGRLDPLDANQ